MHVCILLHRKTAIYADCKDGYTNRKQRTGSVKKEQELSEYPIMLLYQREAANHQKIANHYYNIWSTPPSPLPCDYACVCSVLASKAAVCMETGYHSSPVLCLPSSGQHILCRW